MADLRLAVAGAGGRMGRTLIRAINETPGVALATAFEQPSSPHIGEDAGALAGLKPNTVVVTGDAEAAIASADCLIDFTVPESSVAFAALAAKAGVAHVLGTTGFSAAHEAAIKAAAAKSAIVKSGNMSLGVNLLAALTQIVARTLDEDFDIEILEMHHNRKIDAPSGTALLLGKAAALGRKIDLDAHSARARDGVTGERQRGDIGFASLRGGTVIGEHSVIFAGPAERVELTHKAEDRMIFARGAIKAALWARNKEPGLYSMLDVLGLQSLVSKA